jgi:hypothetical protein
MILRSLSIAPGEGVLFIKRMNIHHKTSTTIPKSPRFPMHARVSGMERLLMDAPPPLLSHCDREAARPSQTYTATDGARMFCDAGGGLGWWLVLPGVGMAVEIYNLSDF